MGTDLNRELRCIELSKLGLIYDGEQYKKDDINVHWSEIVCSSDAEFEKIVSKIKEEIKRRNSILNNHE